MSSRSSSQQADKKACQVDIIYRILCRPLLTKKKLNLYVYFLHFSKPRVKVIKLKLSSYKFPQSSGRKRNCTRKRLDKRCGCVAVDHLPHSSLLLIIWKVCDLLERKSCQSCVRVSNRASPWGVKRSRAEGPTKPNIAMVCPQCACSNNNHTHR